MISITIPKNVVAIDTECTGLSPWLGAKMFATSAVFPSGKVLFWRDEFSGLRQLLKDRSVDKIFQHAKFDLRMLEAAGFQIKGRVWDTMIFGHLVNGQQRSPSLDWMAQTYLPKSRRKVVDEVTAWFIKNKVPTKQRGYKFADLPKPLLKRRCESDATLTYLLFAKLYPTVAKTFSRLLEQEHRLIFVSKTMEDVGLLIDNRQIPIQSRYLDKVVQDVTEFCQAYVGSEDFDINKRIDQDYIMRKADLYDAILERTSTGKPSYSQASLQMLHHPVARMLALGHQASHLKSSFLTQMQRCQVDGIVHPQWNQLGTVTGRFSCSNPNLMNMPEEGGHLSSEEAEEAILLTGIALAPHIKRIFITPPGYSWLYADKEKIEVCMLAHYTRDRTMLEVMRKGLDIHREMSIRMFGEATKGLRVRAKVTVFGFQYGAGDKLLAKNCNCSLKEAKKYRIRLNQTCPSLSPWRDKQIGLIFERGYVLTDHGRRHYLKRQQGYMVVNRMCQGTAADEVKSRMVDIGEWFAKDFPDASIVINVSDAVGAIVPTELLPKVVPTFHQLMAETSIPYQLPLPASCEISSHRLSDLKVINPKTLKVKRKRK